MHFFSTSQHTPSCSLRTEAVNSLNESAALKKQQQPVNEWLSTTKILLILMELCVIRFRKYKVHYIRYH